MKTKDKICVCDMGLLQPDGTLCFLKEFGEYYKENKQIVGSRLRDLINWFKASEIGILCDCEDSQSFIKLKDMGISQDELINEAEELFKKADEDTLKLIRSRLDEIDQTNHIFLKDKNER
ncbi:MAG: hypothetical protein DRM98_00085 [Thermoplasmata archaeon]|nr:MAG: hypothetical protein DRM98_00085 [Thermoplasmata archaeon]